VYDASVGVYLTIVMTMTSISVITAVFVLNLHFRRPDSRPVPSCLRRLLSAHQPISLKLRRHGDVTGLHNDDRTLTMTVETLARELSQELHDSAATVGDEILLASHLITFSRAF